MGNSGKTIGTIVSIVVGAVLAAVTLSASSPTP